ncbi:MAG: hypothetical protein IPJ82_24895 [Lewinellaceae bacterium]|nr:hypothetical protein [Lewinellaceae bacterium]
MRPAMALRGEISGKNARISRFGWRKVMTVGQFAVSLVFMIVVATLWSQLQFMTLADYGFQKENLLTFDLKGNKSETLATEMVQSHRVKGVSAASILIAGNNLQGDQIQRERGGEKTGIFNIYTDENYVPVMGLQLVAGENFRKMPVASGSNSSCSMKRPFPVFNSEHRPKPSAKRFG